MVRALFVNEDIGGHGTLHLHLRRVIEREHPDVQATFVDVPEKGPLRRLASARVPPLDRLDIDLQQIRFQLAQSEHVRRRLAQMAVKPDVLHLYTQNVALRSVRTMRTVPSVVSTDAPNALVSQLLPYRRATWATPYVAQATSGFERRVYEAAARIVSHSEWAASAILELFDVAPSKVRIIPFGIEVPPLPPRDPHRAERRITFVGRSMDRKGGTALLELWRRHWRRDCVLSLVTLDAVPAEPGLEVHNDMLRGDDRLWNLLGRTDVFVFPSEVDTFGYAVMESLAAGVPTVVMDTAAVPEVAPDGEVGFVVPRGDFTALRSAVERLLGDEEMRTRFGAAGRARVEERFDARITTAALVDVLREAVAEGAGR